MRNVRLLRRGLALMPKKSRERFIERTLSCIDLFLREILDKIYKNILVIEHIYVNSNLVEGADVRLVVYLFEIN